MPSNDFEVGYGKPPTHSQFKKGRSGNPKGRPKGTRNFKTDLEEELQERVRINESGKSKEVSKQRAILKRTFEKALKGDMRAISMIGQWVVQHVGMADEFVDTQELSQDDKAIIECALKSTFVATSSSSTTDGNSISTNIDEANNDE